MQDLLDTLKSSYYCAFTKKILLCQLQVNSLNPGHAYSDLWPWCQPMANLIPVARSCPRSPFTCYSAKTASWLKMMPELLYYTHYSLLYYTLYLNSPRITFQLLYWRMMTLIDGPLHDYSDILAHIHGTKIIPFMDAEVKWFTNGNILIQDVQRCAGAVVA